MAGQAGTVLSSGPDSSAYLLAHDQRGCHQVAGVLVWLGPWGCGALGDLVHLGWLTPPSAWGCWLPCNGPSLGWCCKGQFIWGTPEGG